MTTHRKPFRTIREEGKVLGVCAGIADHFGVDVTLVRVGMAVSAFITFPMVVIGYFVVAMVADSNAGARSSLSNGAKRERRPAARPRAEQTREEMRDLDVRLQALERDMTSSGTRLAREIDSLR